MSEGALPARPVRPNRNTATARESGTTGVANLKSMPLDGLRVISFESRRSNEMAELIRRQGGAALVAPAVREVPIEDNPEAFAFAERLFRGDFDMMIFLTGVGTRAE